MLKQSSPPTKSRHHEQTIRNKIVQMKSTLIFFILFFVIIIFLDVQCRKQNVLINLQVKLLAGFQEQKEKNAHFANLIRFSTVLVKQVSFLLRQEFSVSEDDYRKVIHS